MSHTPGPWTWDEPSNWHGLDARVFTPEPYGVVAQVPIEAWRPRSIGRANARLIAAAPDLLYALKLARGYVEAMHNNIASAMGHERTVIRPDLDVVDAAIAKAEGKE